MKYIDADRLRAEIEHLRCVQRTIGERAINSSMRRFYEGTEDMCNQFLSLIDSLQQEQPEVDLKKEYKEYGEGYVEYIRKDALLEWAKEMKEQVGLGLNAYDMGEENGKAEMLNALIDKINSL